MGGEHEQPEIIGAGRGIRLAPGLELSDCGAVPPAMLLGLTAGKVHLNRHAVAILHLCDGSRSRDRVVVDALLCVAGAMRAGDVVAFLEAARARGWIVEGA